MKNSDPRPPRAAMVLGLATLVAALAAGCALIVNFDYGPLQEYEKTPSLAQLEGELQVPGLEAGAEVFRDDYGVPHIFSENEHDLFFTVGYVQAQDRLFQMTLFRAVAEGRMAELLGDVGVPGLEISGFPISTVGLDQRQRTMGLRFLGEVGEAMLREADPRVFAQCQAFCDGVNAFIESHGQMSELPVEFQILGVRPEPIRVRDIISFGKFIGTLLASNLEVEAARHAGITKLGPDRGWELFPIYGAPGPSIVPADLLQNRLAQPRDLAPGQRPSDQELGATPLLSGDAASVLALADNVFHRLLNLDPTMGSNNWVISGKISASGKPMLANDPHLQHLEPSLFYLMRLKGAGYDCMGVTFPGCPYLALGRARRLAWAATTSRADVQDLFVETTDPDRPGQYLHRGQWRDFVRREETIKVRSGAKYKDEVIAVRQSVHGPIMTDFLSALPKDTPPVALRWTGWDFSKDQRVFQALAAASSAEEFMAAWRAIPGKPDFRSFLVTIERLMRAESVDDFIAAMDTIDVPNQNWVAADEAGRIAYLPGGLVPIRGRGIGALPVPGESGDFDWQGFIPLMELPHLIDPERGWVATANNQVVDPRYYPYVFSTHYGEPWRAMRIEELIEELKPLDRDDMVRIQNDIQVRRAVWQVPIILAAVEAKAPKDPAVLAAYEELKNWDYESNLDSTAPVIFFEFLQALFKNVLEDDLDKKTLKLVKLEGYPHMVIDLWLEAGASPYFDDRGAPGKVEDMDDMIVKSLSDAMKKVSRKWGPDPEDHRWGDLHVIKWYHLLGVGKGKVLSVGPYPHLGADNTVRNAKAAYFGTVPYKTFTGPCFRHVIDLADPDHALMVIDGAQSGQYLSPHYQDLHQLYLDSDYIVTEMDETKFKRAAAHRLVLKP